MKYLRISSVLVALLFAVGCGTKSVEKDGNTTQITSSSQQAEEQVENTGGYSEPEETIAHTSNGAGGAGLPEGGFMPDGAISGEDEYAGNNDDSNSTYPYGGGGDDDMANGGHNTHGGHDAYGGNTYMGQMQTEDEMGGYGDAMKLDSLVAIYFDFDRYDVRDDMKEYIRSNAEYIKEHNIRSVVLQGNTDEFGGDEYNTALGLKRALSVRDALVLQGLQKNMFSTISYGMHKPVCKEKTPECYAKNRRTDVVEKQ